VSHEVDRQRLLHAQPGARVPVLALLIFFCVFTLTAVYAFRSHKPTQDRLAALPLEEDSRHD